jgi:hypothetical protein
LAVLIRSLPLLGHLSSWLFHGKMGDDLGFTIVKELEVLFMEIPDGVALRISYHHAYHHQLDIDFESGRFVV